jgi:hypothetical protein
VRDRRGDTPKTPPRTAPQSTHPKWERKLSEPTPPLQSSPITTAAERIAQTEGHKSQ